MNRRHDHNTTNLKVVGDSAPRRPKSDGTLSDTIIRLVGKYWGLALGLMVVFGALAFAGSMLMPKSYEISAKIIVLNKRLSDPAAGAEDNPFVRYESPRAEDMFTEVAILSAPDLLEQALLETRRNYLAKGVTPLPDELLPDYPDEIAQIPPEHLKEIGKLLALNVVPGAYVVEIGYATQDQTYGLSFVNTYLSAYLSRRQSLLEDSDAATYYGDSREYYRARLDEIEAEMLALRRQSRVGDLAREKELNLQQLQMETERATEARDRRREVEQSVAFLSRAVGRFDANPETGPVALPPAIIDDAMVEAQNRLGDALESLNRARTTYLPGNSSILSAEAAFERQAQIYGRLMSAEVAQLRSELSRLNDTIEAKEAEIQTLSDRNIQLEDLIATEATLANEKQATLQAFLGASSRLDAAEAADASGARGYSSVRVLQSATLPAEPMGFSWKVLTVLGLMAGALAAGLIILVRELTAPVVTTMEDAEAVLYPGRRSYRDNAFG